MQFLQQTVKEKLPVSSVLTKITPLTGYRYIFQWHEMLSDRFQGEEMVSLLLESQRALRSSPLKDLFWWHMENVHILSWLQPCWFFYFGTPPEMTSTLDPHHKCVSLPGSAGKDRL